MDEWENAEWDGIEGQEEGGWGELSFAFGVGSLEYQEWGEDWHVGDHEGNGAVETRWEDGWDVVSDGFSDWEEVEGL